MTASQVSPTGPFSSRRNELARDRREYRASLRREMIDIRINWTSVNAGVAPSYNDLMIARQN